MKSLALIILLLAGAAAFAAGAESNIATLFAQAQGWAKTGQYDDALHLYELLITTHLEVAGSHPGWFDAELGIAQALAKKGDFAEAAKAAHLCLDGAPTQLSFSAAVTLSAGILSALDKDVTRANQFIAFEQTGAGTNPMEAIGYPALPEREKAFDAIRKQAGDDAAASRLRAFTYLFSGRPKDAVPQLCDAFRRSSTASELQRAGADLVGVGLRDLRGHCVGLDKDMQFLIHGTGEADPFATLAATAPAAGQGGLAGLSADDLKLLSQVHDAARLYAGDPFLPATIRGPALAAMARANGGLDNWGAPGQEDWYLHFEQLFLESQKGRRVRDDSVESRLLDNAQNAARGRSLNLGGVADLWDKIDALYAANGAAVTAGSKRVRGQFTATSAVLNKANFQTPTLKPLSAPRVSF